MHHKSSWDSPSHTSGKHAAYICSDKDQRCQKKPQSFTALRYCVAKKYTSEDSFLLASGFTVFVFWNSSVSLFCNRWLWLPAQVLQRNVPPGCRMWGAMSRRDKHRPMILSWSRPRIPVALGAMSLRITSALPPGSSSWILWKVPGSVTLAGHRKVAPSRGDMWRRSTPSTKPTGVLGSKEEMVSAVIYLHPVSSHKNTCNKVIK